MDLTSYLAEKRRRLSNANGHRTLCRVCLQSMRTCYCAQLKPFDPRMKFVILIHPLEFRRRIATGRMTYLCTKNSELIRGHDYSKDERVGEIISDPQNHCMVLYPGAASKNLSHLTMASRQEFFVDGRKPVIFVLDGTWHTARKTLLLSKNLQKLPRICFIPPSPSSFQVRKQPTPECYSTLEAVHHTIELLGPAAGFNVASRDHDRLINVFHWVVEQQLLFARSNKSGSRHGRYTYASSQSGL